MKRTSETRTPPYLSVIESAEGPVLTLTVDVADLNVCAQCTHLHVRVLNLVAIPDVIRHFATSLRHWADRLEAS